jgi:hypothetical protein
VRDDLDSFYDHITPKTQLKRADVVAEEKRDEAQAAAQHLAAQDAKERAAKVMSEEHNENEKAAVTDHERFKEESDRQIKAQDAGHDMQVRVSECLCVRQRERKRERERERERGRERERERVCIFAAKAGQMMTCMYPPAHMIRRLCPLQYYHRTTHVHEAPATSTVSRANHRAPQKRRRGAAPCPRTVRYIYVYVYVYVYVCVYTN